MALLRSLGFEAWSVMCRTAARGTDLRPVNHRGIAVKLDGEIYFCDVGYGGPMAPFAVRVSPEKQTRYEETYWATPLADQGWYLLQRLSGKGLTDDGTTQGEEKSVCVFSLLPVTEGDFEPYSLKASSYPDSNFVLNRTVARRTPDGYINLRGQALTVSKAGVRTEEEIAEEKIPAELEEYFGLKLD